LVREQCVTIFKQKALGQEITEYERILREGISRSSQKLKAQFMKHCETKAREFLEPEVQAVRKKLHEDFYKSMDMV